MFAFYSNILRTGNNIFIAINQTMLILNLKKLKLSQIRALSSATLNRPIFFVFSTRGVFRKKSVLNQKKSINKMELFPYSIYFNNKLLLKSGFGGLLKIKGPQSQLRECHILSMIYCLEGEVKHWGSEDSHKSTSHYNSVEKKLITSTPAKFSNFQVENRTAYYFFIIFLHSKLHYQ